VTPVRKHRVVVMGVSAVGKTTVGTLLASELVLPFIDGDDLHAPEAIAKMASGTPLDDDDRAPWLRSCGRALQQAPDGAVIACSALRRRYRDLIRREAPDAVFVHLRADPALVLRRAGEREGHFMPASLVTSQENALEPLESDEVGYAADVNEGDAAALVHEIRMALEILRAAP